jgi:hypothetical protein
MPFTLKRVSLIFICLGLGWARSTFRHSNRLFFGSGLPVEPLNHRHQGPHILCQKIDTAPFKPESCIGMAKAIKGSFLPTAIESQPSRN